MLCPECDSDLPAAAKFCHHCGLQLKAIQGKGVQPQAKVPTGLGNKSPLADEEETILWRGSYSAKGLIHSWLLAALISVVLPVGAVYVNASPLEWMVIAAILLLIWGCLGLLLFVQRLNVHYELTDQRLIHRSGILRRRTNRIELIDMDDVSHEQGLFERLFDVGTIRITSSDRSHPNIDLPAIDNVDGVAMLIDDARRRERIRRGIHIEQI